MMHTDAALLYAILYHSLNILLWWLPGHTDG